MCLSGRAGRTETTSGKIHEGRSTCPRCAAKVEPAFNSTQSQVSSELCSCAVSHTNLLWWAGLLRLSFSSIPACRSPSPFLPLFLAVSLYDKAWPLRHSRRKHCACFHQSPLWQRQMVQSSTFTSIPAGMIVVPAKQFGPVALGREGGSGLGQEIGGGNDKNRMCITLFNLLWVGGGACLF